MKPWVLHSLLLLSLAFLLGLTACRKREPSERVDAPVARAQPVRPREVIGELLVPRPAELWPALRAFVSGPAEFLPAAPELAVAGLLGFDVLSGGAFDFRSPCAAALVVDDAGKPAMVFGFRVENGPELVARLSTGNAPSHRLETEGEIAWLTPLGAGANSGLAVVGDSVLLGPRPALSRAADYVARGLLLRATTPQASAARLHLFGDALRDVAVPALRARWAAARRELMLAQERESAARNRPADFADPAALLAGADAAVEPLLAVLETAAGIEGELLLAKDALTVVAQITPRGEGAASELGKGLPLGAASALGALPDTTAVALLLRRVLPEPSQAATQTTDPERAVRSLFGPRLGAAEERALREVSQAVDVGRGAEQIFGLLAEKSLVWRGTVRDPAMLRRGLSGAYKIAAREPLRGVFRELLGQPQVSSSLVSSAGLSAPVERTLFTFSPSAAQRGTGKKAARMELLSLVDAERFLVVAAAAGAASLEPALLAEKGDRSLAEAPVAGPMLAASNQVSLALFFDLAEVGIFNAPGEAPMLLSFGATQSIPQATLTLSQAAVRALIDYGIRK